MTTETAQLFFAVLTLVAAAGAVALLVLRLLAATNTGARTVLGDVHRAALWLAFLVATVSTLGSLYFSEVADFVPCTLCWYQRIAMYPLSVILLVGAIRGDRAVRWYAAPVAAAGAVIAAYHYLIEWRPELDAGTCDAFGPPCTAVWFRELGFISLAFMALVGFLAILALLFLPLPAASPDEGSEGDEVDGADAGERVEPVDDVDAVAT